jgi:hypothetical protein
MPKQKNILQFSVPKDTLNQLETHRREGESISMCAKRLLLERLSSNTTSTTSVSESQESPILNKILNAINDLKVSPKVKPEEINIDEHSQCEAVPLDDLNQRVKDLERKNLALIDWISKVEVKVDSEIRHLQYEVEDGYSMIAHLNDWINDGDDTSQKIGLITPSFELGIAKIPKSDNTHNQILDNKESEMTIANSETKLVNEPDENFEVDKPEMTIAKSDEQILSDGEHYPTDPPAVNDFVQNPPPEEIDQPDQPDQPFSQTNTLRSWRRQKRFRN